MVRGYQQAAFPSWKRGAFRCWTTAVAMRVQLDAVSCQICVCVVREVADSQRRDRHGRSGQRGPVFPVFDMADPMGGVLLCGMRRIVCAGWPHRSVMEATVTGR